MDAYVCVCVCVCVCIIAKKMIANQTRGRQISIYDKIEREGFLYGDEKDSF